MRRAGRWRALPAGHGLLPGLQRALQAGDAEALRQACLPLLPALKLQLRGLLAHHLGSGPLRTRQLVLDVRRLLDTA